eukprot:7279650-Ditylum_brightwellii.AAC.1
MSYQVRVQVLNACHYGDPQDRKRVILVAAKRGRQLAKFPEITHGVESDGTLHPLVTVKGALSNLETIEPAQQGSGIVKIDETKVMYNHGIEGTNFRAENETLIADKPAMTVRRTNAVKHYAKERTLTVREYARLQSFPDEYRFYAGSYMKQRGQIGNAVPIRLATAIAKSIRELSYP